MSEEKYPEFGEAGWRWDRLYIPGCSCGCSLCEEFIGCDPEVPCPDCPLHGHKAQIKLSEGQV